MKHTPNLSTLLFCLLFIPIFFISACKEDDDKSNPTTPATASVEGIVRSPNGHVIGAAKVKAGIYSTKTDETGYFKLNLTPGVHNLVIYTGSGNLFKTSQTINLAPGETLEMLPVQTELKQVGTMAYIPGVYDAIETIIIDSLGYNATQIMIYDLGSFSTLSSYDALFLNCGALESANITMNSIWYANLEMYLQNHGSIYASDYAVEMLTGDGFFRPAPGRDKAAFVNNNERNSSTTCFNGQMGGFLPDSSLCTTKSGPVALVPNADIIDPDIALAVGSNSVDINYDLENWEIVNSYGPPMNVIISHNAFGPLALRSDPFSPEYGGTIFYTTFHSEPQGYISPAVKSILQYFILNL